MMSINHRVGKKPCEEEYWSEMKIFAECKDNIFEFDYNENGDSPVLKLKDEKQNYSFINSY